MGNDTGMMNTTLAYAAQHGSEIGKEQRKIGESIGKDTIIMNDNSTMMNTTQSTSTISIATLAYVQETEIIRIDNKYDDGRY